jgi:hypothetical protein
MVLFLSPLRRGAYVRGRDATPQNGIASPPKGGLQTKSVEP